jgi:hypothetical protein
MRPIKLILVETTGCCGMVLPLANAHEIVELELDPDKALERVRAHYAKRWGASVHALRWIFPRDLLLPSPDHSPFLVLHVDGRGNLPAADKGRIDNTCSCEARLHESDPILRVASRPSKAEPWSDPRWLTNATKWIGSHFGGERVRRISQVRVSLNGAVLKIETAEGTYFMKTIPSAFSYEPRLLQLLHRHLPGICPSVVPICPDNQSHITRAIDGSPLRLINDPAGWEAALEDVAKFQLGCVPQVEEIRSLGLHSQSFREFMENLEQILSNLVALQKGAAGELTQRELDRIPLLIIKARQAGEILGECRIPETLVHGDLNESNVFRTVAGTTPSIDWTFSGVAHPFFALGFSLFAASDPAHRMHGCWEQLRDAYSKPWRQYAQTRKLVAGIDAASRLFWIETAQALGRLILEIQQEFPGTPAHLPVVLRRSLVALGCA